jgi:hypothetical protein
MTGYFLENHAAIGLKKSIRSMIYKWGFEGLKILKNLLAGQKGLFA